MAPVGPTVLPGLVGGVVRPWRAPLLSPRCLSSGCRLPCPPLTTPWPSFLLPLWSLPSLHLRPRPHRHRHRHRHHRHRYRHRYRHHRRRRRRCRRRRRRRRCRRRCRRRRRRRRCHYRPRRHCRRRCHYRRRPCRCRRCCHRHRRRHHCRRVHVHVHVRRVLGSRRSGKSIKTRQVHSPGPYSGSSASAASFVQYVFISSSLLYVFSIACPSLYLSVFFPPLPRAPHRISCSPRCSFSLSLSPGLSPPSVFPPLFLSILSSYCCSIHPRNLAAPSSVLTSFLRFCHVEWNLEKECLPGAFVRIPFIYVSRSSRA